MATEALLARGARTIATITGPLDMCAGLDRLAGYRAALHSARRRPLGRHVVTGDFTVEGGAVAMNRLLDADPGIDAVFAASDLTALGAIRALTERGLRVPEDVAVVGFDDVHEAQLGRPALTTVHQPITELGRTMARMLLGRLNGNPVERTAVLPVELVRRQSA
jgi:DNA-binding LacI/PurR family transcriptional regulator